ncbi:MAG TPA: hypothetical protein VLR26_06395 [Frankiaceae bacterium]|nr:hypothetical protein [Frankiaceae bacterium]
MRRRGVSATVLSLVVGLVVLAGCTKPTPQVTVQSGATTLRSEPVNYQLDGKTVTNNAGAKVLTLRPGDNVNISVDKKTASAGWVVLLGGQKISPILGHGQHHFSFQAPGFSGGAEAPLAIFQQPPNGGPAAGSWVFTLREEI